MGRGEVKLIVAFLVFWLLGGLSAFCEEGPTTVKIDMKTWHLRDWEDCNTATEFRYVENGVQFISEQSSGLLWQIPTQSGKPMELDAKKHTWLKKCERPPRSFNDDVQKQGFEDFIDVSEYPYVTWRWKVDYSTIDEQKIKKSGRLEKKYDDFTAKLGISILKKGSNSIREVAYVWSNTLPDSTMFRTETTIIPFVWKMEWQRFVAESGLENLKQWVPEVRNLYEDYKKGYPGEEPGKILRVYLMTDTDNTKSRASTWYADVVFHKEAPK